MSEIVRFGFLARSESLTPEQFHEHWERSHGPLAMSLAGFRKYTIRYVQNHFAADSPTGFDGIAMSGQLVRDDYTIGFYHEPDYSTIQVDERYMMDLGTTVSMLADVDVAVDGERTPFKAMVITDSTAPADWDAQRVSIARLRTETASALGFGQASFDHDILVELWFASAADLEAVKNHHEATKAPGIFLPVTELVFL